MPALVALGLLAVGAIGFGVFTALKGSGGSTATAPTVTQPDDKPDDKPNDDDDDKKKKKIPLAVGDSTDKADPKPLGNDSPGSDPTEKSTTSATAAPTAPVVVKQPVVVQPKPPQKPPQNCSPGTVNPQGRCDCPPGFRSIGPSGSARCQEEPDDEDPP